MHRSACTSSDCRRPCRNDSHHHRRRSPQPSMTHSRSRLHSRRARCRIPHRIAGTWWQCTRIGWASPSLRTRKAADTHHSSTPDCNRRTPSRNPLRVLHRSSASTCSHRSDWGHRPRRPCHRRRTRNRWSPRNRPWWCRSSRSGNHTWRESTTHPARTSRLGHRKPPGPWKRPRHRRPHPPENRAAPWPLALPTNTPLQRQRALDSRPKG
jgi:hypothetical protein